MTQSKDEQANIIQQCPFSSMKSLKNTLPIKPWSMVGKINYLGMKYFKKYWLFQYFGRVYPGVLAHFAANNLLNDFLYGQKKYMEHYITHKGTSLYEYCVSSGLNDFAKKNGGICTFRLHKNIIIYQISNIPLVEDHFLDPTTARTAKLFGEFIGTLPSDSKLRRKKRAILESVLGNMSFLKNHQGKVEEIIQKILIKYNQQNYCLEKFSQEIISDVASCFPGLIDFTIKPISRYFDQYNDTTINFFDFASAVIANPTTPSSKKFLRRICAFVKTILTDNYSSIKSSTESNIIKRYFKIWEIPFELDNIQNLAEEKARELGTIIVNIFESTSLSLGWAISYLENNPYIKERIMQEQKNLHNNSYIELVILESIRLSGNNPTILSRKVIKEFELKIGPNKIVILPGTILWLNRREANQNAGVFSNPKAFDPNNIKNIMKDTNENIKSLLAKDRYEVNSFSAINTKDNTRKCPARLYSIFIQSLIIQSLYRDFQITLEESQLQLDPKSNMPRPTSFGTIKISKK